MLTVSSSLSIPDHEIELHAVRAQGAGGQNVNKVSNAVHLRFDIRASSLPEITKARLLALNDQRVTKDGVVVIKSQQFRSLEKNRDEALDRLRELIRRAQLVRAVRKPTRPTLASRTRRLDDKRRRQQVKGNRGRVID